MTADGREAVAASPFTVFIDPDPARPYLTYAVPERGAQAPWGEEAIAALRATFEERGREPRVDFIERCWPGLTEALVSAGFEIEHRLPGLIAGPEAVRSPPVPEGLEIEAVGRGAGEASIRALLIVQREAFGETYSVDADAIELFRRIGTDSVLARLADGTPVGGAGRLAVHDGVSEIVAVGVDEHWRGRGIGGALTAAASERAVRAGAELLFITPENERAGRVYERAGFVLEPACTRVKLKLPA